MEISNLLIFIQFTPVSKCSKCWEVASWCESRFPCLNEKTLLFDLTRLSWVLFLWFSHYLYLVEKILPNLMHLNMEQRKKGGWENLRGKFACLTNLGSAVYCLKRAPCHQMLVSPEPPYRQTLLFAALFLVTERWGCHVRPRTRSILLLTLWSM